MPVSRRSFLRSGATAALTAGIALSVPQLAFGQSGTDAGQDASVPFEAQQNPLFYFRRETFQPYVGGTFRVSAGRKSVEMTLKEVLDCTPSSKSTEAMKAAQKTDCFALVFSSDGELSDLTTIYDVEHAALGKFKLFLTRREGPTSTRAHIYEAVFSRLL